MQSLTTEEKIINAGMAEFAQHGYDGARIDRIAKRAKINKAMIYYHFKGKEALYRRILEDTVKRLYLSILDKEPEGSDPLERINSIVSSFIRHIHTVDLNFVRIMLREISGGGKFMKEIFIPRLHLPFLQKMEAHLTEGREKRLIRDVHAYYTVVQIIGPVVLFNAMRIVLKDTPLFEKLYGGDYVEHFTRNMISVLNDGIRER